MTNVCYVSCSGIRILVTRPVRLADEKKVLAISVNTVLLPLPWRTPIRSSAQIGFPGVLRDELQDLADVPR